MKKFLGWTGLGAVVAYFLDPEQGNRRRMMLVQRTGGLVRRVFQKGQRAGRAATSQAHGVTQKVAHVREEEKDLTDETLKSKVETELFREADSPKGRVNVNVVDGVVYLRGELEPEAIEELVASARTVTGVKGVENLMHPPGTTAPTTPEASSS